MALVTKREQQIAADGLGCLVQALQGMRITIDMRNESSVTGTIKEVDSFMNIMLEEASYEDCIAGDVHRYETLYIKGRNIRYIHIPKNVSVRETIIKFLTKTFHRKVDQTSSMQRFRMRKLQQNQQETRVAVQKIKQNKSGLSKNK